MTETELIAQFIQEQQRRSTVFKLSEAHLCVNCDCIHIALMCPKCFSENYLLLSQILNRSAE